MSDEIGLTLLAVDGVEYELEARPARYGGDVLAFARIEERTVFRGFARDGGFFVEYDDSTPAAVIAELRQLAGVAAPAEPSPEASPAPPDTSPVAEPSPAAASSTSDTSSTPAEDLGDASPATTPTEPAPPAPETST